MNRFDQRELVEKLDAEDRKKLLVDSRKGYFYGAGAIAAVALIAVIIGKKQLGIVLAAGAILCAVYGLRYLLSNKETQTDFITSVLVNDTIKGAKQRGETFTKEQLDAIRYRNDPLFQKAVIKKIHRKEDKRYAQDVARASKELRSLQNARENMIEKIRKERWQTVDPKISCNDAEGIVSVDGKQCRYCDVKGAILNEITGYRTESHEEGDTEHHVSIGGAIVGGLVAGPIGAVVGGAALGRETSSKHAVAHQIPLCEHLGVRVNLNGFVHEVVFLEETVEKTDKRYVDALNKAQSMISQLEAVSRRRMPDVILLPEEEDSVLSLNESIDQAIIHLDEVKSVAPVYNIPERYTRDME